MKLPALSLLLLFALGIGIFALPQASFSETERRALQTWRAPTLASLADGSFAKQVQNFYTDQFPLRRRFTAAKAYGERLLGKQENNGILFGKNGYLIPKDEYADLSVLEANLQAILAFEARAERPVTLLLAPRSVDVMTSCHPTGYDDTRARRAITQIQEQAPHALLPLAELRGAAEDGAQVWYRTDHHWTTHGAYLAYRILASNLGITPYPPSFFRMEIATADFLGTSYSKIGGVAEAADAVVLYRYEGDDRFRVQNPETGQCRAGFYDRTATERQDAYEIFLGGNAGLLTVRDPQAASPKPRLLLIKDSFANALLPFLALHFDVDLIDPRYAGGRLASHVDVEAYDRVLILEGVDTLATDPSLSRLLVGSPHSPS